MAKRACITGAGGYIASWIVAKLLERGYSVHGTLLNPEDQNSSGHLKKLPGAEEKLTLFKADLLDYDANLLAIRGCDVVFHTACPMARIYDDPDDVLRPAIEGSRNVLQACFQEGVKHVVFTSTVGAMYLNPNRPEEQIIDESCWTDSENAKQNQLWYTVAKTNSEKLVTQLGAEFGIHVVVICPGYVFGPILQGTINASVEILSTLMDGSRTSYAMNRQHQIVDVRDVADAHIAAYEDSNASGRYHCIAYCKLGAEIIHTLKENFPQYSYPDKCESEASDGIPFDKLCNKKILSLIKDFIPYEKTLVDTVASLQEKGLLAR